MLFIIFPRKLEKNGDSTKKKKKSEGGLVLGGMSVFEAIVSGMMP